MTVEPLSPPRAGPDAPVARAPSFWRRQFAPERTDLQVLFDVVFGVVLPLVLVPTMSFLGASDIQPFGEVLRPMVVKPFVLMEIAVFVAWLLARRHLGAANAALAGALLAGATLALVCSVDLLPVSAMALVVGVGVLGFIPFGTSLAFVRAHRAAWTLARADAGRAACFALAAAGFAVTAGAPFAAASWIDREVREATPAIVDADPAAAAAATARLARIAWYPGFTADPILDRFERETDDAAKGRIGAAYRAITGRDPEDVIAERD